MNDKNGNQLATVNRYDIPSDKTDKGADTEEIYLRARYYQPSVGRFLTRDSYTGESDDPESLHLYTYCENDGVNAWDPSGNLSLTYIANKIFKSKKFKKVIKKRIRYIADKWRYSCFGKQFAEDTAKGNNRALLNKFDFFYEPGKKEKEKVVIYHTHQNCWQRIGGYNKLYNFCFDAATKMDSRIFSLQTATSRYNLKKTYVLWAWKGDYFNLGAGGEMGIYYHYISLHSFAADKNPIYDSMVFRCVNHKTITWNPKNLSWWMTTFVPTDNIKKVGDISVSYNIDLSRAPKDLKKSFYRYTNSKKEAKKESVSLQGDSKKISELWKKHRRNHATFNW